MRLPINFLSKCLLAAFFVLLTVRIPAGFILLGEEYDEGSGVLSISLRYSPDPVETYSGERKISLPSTEEGTDEDLRVFLEDPAPWPAVGQSSALIALPGEPIAPPSLAAIESYGTNYTDGFQCTVVQTGSIHALQVKVLSDPEADCDLDVRVRVGAGTRQSPSKRGLPHSQQFLNGLFINPKPLTDNILPRSGSAKSTQVHPPSTPGDHRVTYKEGRRIIRVPLSSLGTELGGFSTVSLDHHGSLLPMGGTIGTDLWLYAPYRDTLTDLDDTVFVTLDPPSPSVAMPTRGAYDSLTPVATDEIPTTRTQTYQPFGRYERSASKPIGERFVIHQVRLPFSASTPPDEEDVVLEICDTLTDPNVAVEVELLGLTESPAQDPDHQTEILLEGIAAPIFTWDGRDPHTETMTISLPALPNPTSVTLTHRIPSLLSGISADRQDLASITLSWTGKPRMGPDGRCRLELETGSSPRLVTVGGLPNGTSSDDVIVLDVTVPESPVRLTGFSIFADDDGGAAVEFEAPASAGVFHVELLSSIDPADEVLPAEQMPALPTERLDRLYVRPDELATPLQPLVTLRGAANTIELDPQAAYNVYNGGQQDPEAIRMAVADIVASVSSKLPIPTLLLVGHGSLDRRDYLQTQSGAQVPPFVVESVPTTSNVTIESPIDYPYGLVEGSDDLIDMRVGRLTVRTSAELTDVINRIAAHESQVEALQQVQRPGLFITDNDSEFLADAATWPALWDQTDQPSIRYDIPPPPLSGPELTAIRSQIHGYFEEPEGVAFALYMGHGNTDRWAGEDIVNVNDVPNIDTENKWPIVATLTCLNGYYAFPGGNLSLSEAWLLEPNRGAIANFAASTIEYYYEQSLFSESVMETMALPAEQRPTDAGGVFTAAQIKFVTDHPVIASSVRSFVFFGDPESSFAFYQHGAAAVSDWMILY